MLITFCREVFHELRMVEVGVRDTRENLVFLGDEAITAAGGHRIVEPASEVGAIAGGKGENVSTGDGLWA
jgi:hypothetical protein